MFLTGSQIRIGRVAGHELRLDLIAFGLFGAWVYLTAGGVNPVRTTASFLVAGFLSIFVHEMGHALTIHRLTGQHTVVVMGFGGATLSLGEKRASHQLLISLAGPAAGFVLGVVGWVVAMWAARHYSWQPWAFDHLGSIWLLTLRYLILVSIVWGLFNLLPAVPLDGGQALRAVLEIAGLRAATARRLTRYLTLAIAAGLCVWTHQTDASRFFYFIALWVALAVLDEFRAEGW